MRKTVDSILGNTLVLIMTLMVINVLWQVFSRYVLGTPSSFTDELARFLMIWIGVLGTAYVAGRNGHVAIDFFANRTKESIGKKLKIIVRIAIIAFCTVAMVIGGLRLVHITYLLEQYSPALGLPLAIVYLVIPISGLLIIYYKVSDMLMR